MKAKDLQRALLAEVDKRVPPEDDCWEARTSAMIDSVIDVVAEQEERIKRLEDLLAAQLRLAGLDKSAKP